MWIWFIVSCYHKTDAGVFFFCLNINENLINCYQSFVNWILSLKICIERCLIFRNLKRNLYILICLLSGIWWNVESVYTTIFKAVSKHFCCIKIWKYVMKEKEIVTRKFWKLLLIINYLLDVTNKPAIWRFIIILGILLSFFLLFFQQKLLLWSYLCVFMQSLIVWETWVS